MMTKKRLQELIEQGATIYDIFKGDIYLVDLTMAKYYDVPKYIEYKNDYYNCNLTRSIDDLFESEEDARWELEMTATRTETLKLPNWNELNLNYSHCKEFYKSFYNKDSKYTLEINIPDTIALFYYGNNDGEVECGYIFDRDFTKENYIEACKLAKKLFLGEEV